MLCTASSASLLYIDDIYLVCVYRPVPPWEMERLISPELAKKGVKILLHLA